MGFYTDMILNEDTMDDILDDEDFDYDALDEACAISMLSRLPDDELKSFIESEECEELINEGKISKKMVVKLNKGSDLTRRQTLAAYQIAKDKNDIDWQRFIKFKSLANQHKHRILEKYARKSETIAKKSQRNYISGKGTAAAVKSAIDSRRSKEVAAGKAGAV